MSENTIGKCFGKRFAEGDVVREENYVGDVCSCEACSPGMTISKEVRYGTRYLDLPFCNLVVDYATFLALVQEVVYDDNWTLFRVRFKPLVITKVCIFVIRFAAV